MIGLFCLLDKDHSYPLLRCCHRCGIPTDRFSWRSSSGANRSHSSDPGWCWRKLILHLDHSLESSSRALEVHASSALQWSIICQSKYYYHATSRSVIVEKATPPLSCPGASLNTEHNSWTLSWFNMLSPARPLPHRASQIVDEVCPAIDPQAIDAWQTRISKNSSSSIMGNTSVI